MMNDDEIWAAIDDERRRTADLLGQLSDDEWAQPSLCAGWTVRDVAAHLTLQQLTVGDIIRMVLRHPGSLNSMISASARRRATRPTDRLIADLRAMIGGCVHQSGVEAGAQ
ncbi:maleylpyruvate isomerase family mycothiol-dependent enzyme [Rhodococcus chondri]|uniref:Maleylpyruvate isomerase family mycothiol-dependent enzyme n=1 Tax=Rhodococcus chondri TaxID=3065941 RepID=A0ABU7JY42_9NOCA|nr:maleylpyruvate isomerase family mycothiol-dependent enzyme [Rhodococcus sp. CC-R104]MEE2034839.1 maleylpyruvate isomerase family mycothiol-dependent enzyme [Rhodococcus sp. CC-R104]